MCVGSSGCRGSEMEAQPQTSPHNHAKHEILNRWENSPLWIRLGERCETALWHHYQFISQKMWDITHNNGQNRESQALWWSGILDEYRKSASLITEVHHSNKWLKIDRHKDYRLNINQSLKKFSCICMKCIVMHLGFKWLIYSLLDPKSLTNHVTMLILHIFLESILWSCI